MPRDDGGTLYMKGFILTLNELSDIGYYPVTSPIFFVKESRPDARFEWADAMLTDIEKKFLPFRG